MASWAKKEAFIAIDEEFAQYQYLEPEQIKWCTTEKSDGTIRIDYPQQVGGFRPGKYYLSQSTHLIEVPDEIDGKTVSEVCGFVGSFDAENQIVMLPTHVTSVGDSGWSAFKHVIFKAPCPEGFQFETRLFNYGVDTASTLPAGDIPKIFIKPQHLSSWQSRNPATFEATPMYWGNQIYFDNGKYIGWANIKAY